MLLPAVSPLMYISNAISSAIVGGVVSPITAYRGRQQQIELQDRSFDFERERWQQQSLNRREEVIEQFRMGLHKDVQNYIRGNWPISSLPEQILATFSDKQNPPVSIFLVQPQKAFNDAAVLDIHHNINQYLVEFLDEAYGSNHNKYIAFGSRAWIRSLHGQAAGTFVHSWLSSLPVLMLEYDILANRIVINAACWGMGDDFKYWNVVSVPVSDINIQTKSSIAENIAAMLALVCTSQVDAYFLQMDQVAPRFQNTFLHLQAKGYEENNGSLRKIAVDVASSLDYVYGLLLAEADCKQMTERQKIAMPLQYAHILSVLSEKERTRATVETALKLWFSERNIPLPGRSHEYIPSFSQSVRGKDKELIAELVDIMARIEDPAQEILEQVEEQLHLKSLR